MSFPHLSIIMPVYNSELYLSDAIDSVLNQTFTDFEFLIFNDGSSDRSKEIINSYGDTRISYFESEQNMGYVFHLNQGLSISTGKYIARMDSDDICCPERFDKQIGYLNAHPDCGICGSWFRTFGSYEQEIKYPVRHEEIQLELLSSCPIGHPTVILRRDVITKYNLRYNANYCPSEDYELWSKISFLTRMHNYPEILLNYRIHDVQVSSVKEKTSDQKFQEARDLFINLLCSRICADSEFSKMENLFSEKISLTKIKHFESLALNCINENEKSGMYNTVNLKYSFHRIFKELCLRYSYLSPLAVNTFLSSPISRYSYFGPKYLRNLLSNFLLRMK